MANILLVDDSSEILDAMQYILEMEGYTVRSVLGKDAMMEEIEEFAPDLIILDVLLSGDNGRDITKALKANEDTRDIPVILMSANHKWLLDYEECGAVNIISKPFHLSDLTDKVGAALKMLPLFFINLHSVSHNFIHYL